MIKPRKDTPTGRILVLICATPGEETIESLAAHVFAPPTPRPFRSYAEVKARREALVVHAQTSRKRTARIVQHLAEAGYLESKGGPVISEWFAERMARDGVAEALRVSGPRYHASLAAIGAKGPLDFDGWHEGPGVLHAALIQRVVGEVGNPPTTVAQVVGSKPNGRVAKVWADLIEWSIVIPPRARFPTAKALDLVASWEASCNSP